MTVLEVNDVRKAFRGLHAVDGVSFTVERGAILGVIGPNGAGKTTLFDLIGGTLRPDAGRVVLDGRDVTGSPAHRVARAGLARTFQLMRPFASMTVRENVCVAALTRDRAGADERADAVIARVGLEPWRDTRAGELPTAGRKRLELARALATRPHVLLLDEVLSGLVPAEREPLLELLTGLRDAEGLTLVLIEHIMAAVMRLSDRVLVLDQGRVLATGTPEEVTRDPRVIEVYLGEERFDDG
ncbi:MAG: ATP-binding cassette domain-containing protein [Streptosporangiales bacterium]|nr:ATP-binding cassette domain-containing protein [Streptosporangiales bacterium]